MLIQQSISINVARDLWEPFYTFSCIISASAKHCVFIEGLHFVSWFISFADLYIQRGIENRKHTVQQKQRSVLLSYLVVINTTSSKKVAAFPLFGVSVPQGSTAVLKQMSRLLCWQKGSGSLTLCHNVGLINVTSSHHIRHSVHLISLQKEGWGRNHIHITFIKVYYYSCSILFPVMVVDLLHHLT